MHQKYRFLLKKLSGVSPVVYADPERIAERALRIVQLVEHHAAVQPQDPVRIIALLIQHPPEIVHVTNNNIFASRALAGQQGQTQHKN